MSIDYVTGDATDPQGDGPKVLVHVCNDVEQELAGLPVKVYDLP